MNLVTLMRLLCYLRAHRFANFFVNRRSFINPAHIKRLASHLHAYQRPCFLDVTAHRLRLCLPFIVCHLHPQLRQAQQRLHHILHLIFTLNTNRHRMMFALPKNLADHSRARFARASLDKDAHPIRICSFDDPRKINHRTGLRHDGISRRLARHRISLRPRTAVNRRSRLRSPRIFNLMQMQLVIPLAHRFNHLAVHRRHAFHRMHRTAQLARKRHHSGAIPADDTFAWRVDQQQINAFAAAHRSSNFLALAANHADEPVHFFIRAKSPRLAGCIAVAGQIRCEERGAFHSPEHFIPAAFRRPPARGKERRRLAQAVPDHRIRCNAKTREQIGDHRAQTNLPEDDIAVTDLIERRSRPESAMGKLREKSFILRILCLQNLRPAHAQRTPHAQVLISSTGIDEGEAPRRLRRSVDHRHRLSIKQTSLRLMRLFQQHMRNIPIHTRRADHSAARPIDAIAQPEPRRHIIRREQIVMQTKRRPRHRNQPRRCPTSTDKLTHALT